MFNKNKISNRVYHGILISLLMGMTACGGGGGGSPGGTNNTSNNTGGSQNSIPSRSLPMTNAVYADFDATISKGHLSASASNTTLTVGYDGQVFKEITLQKTVTELCASVNSGGYGQEWAIDEQRGHYGFACSNTTNGAIAIVDENGAEVWSSGVLSNTYIDGHELYLKDGRVYLFYDRQSRIYSADYESGQSLTTFHNFQLNAGKQRARLNPAFSQGTGCIASACPAVTFYPNGSLFLNSYTEFNFRTDGSIYNGEDLFYVINPDGSFETKVSLNSLAAGMTQVSGEQYAVPVRVTGMDNDGAVSLWFPTMIDTNTGKVVKVAYSDLDLLKAMESPTMSGIPNVLSCAAYGSGMCATYTFTKVEDVANYKIACAEVASCSKTGAVGICTIGPDSTTSGSGGQVISDLYLYSPSYEQASARDTCLGPAGGSSWQGL